MGPERDNRAQLGCRVWIRTKIQSFKGSGPTIRRPGSDCNNTIYYECARRAKETISFHGTAISCGGSGLGTKPNPVNILRILSLPVEATTVSIRGVFKSVTILVICAVSRRSNLSEVIRLSNALMAFTSNCKRLTLVSKETFESALGIMCIRATPGSVKIFG